MMLHDEDWNILTGQALADAEAAVAAGARLKITTSNGGRLMSAAEEAATRAKWAENSKPTLADFERGVQSHLDAAAKRLGFDSIFTAATYIGDPDAQFAADAAALTAWRSRVWRYCYTQLAAVKSGQRQPPASVEAFIAELPAVA